MAFKLFNQASAREFGMRIVNGYKQSHNIPIIGTGVMIPTSPERIKNKLRQSQHRTTHSRMTVWDNDDNAALLAPVKIKLFEIRQARKAYDHALSQLGIAQKRSDYNIIHGLDNSNQLTLIIAKQIIVDEKLVILNNAKAI